MTTLVADVGGTNTRVGIAREGLVEHASVARFRNADFASLGDLLKTYLSSRGIGLPQAACVCVAGPVRHGIGRLTNRDWIVTEDELCSVTGAASGHVLNDLSAQGYALDHVAVRPVLASGATRTDPAETRLVIGIGTGFNAAPVYCTPAGLLVVPSECGHASLPIRDATSAQLAEGLVAHHGFASVEDVLSGRGIPQTFRMLTGRTPPNDASQILALARADSQGTEGTVIAAIVACLGRVAGDLALIHLPFGGIVLIGGVARALVPFLADFGFAAAMCDKGRFSDFLAQFPVFVMEDDDAALHGCAIYADSIGPVSR